jgi:hypothetical protein
MLPALLCEQQQQLVSAGQGPRVARLCMTANVHDTDARIGLLLTKNSLRACGTTDGGTVHGRFACRALEAMASMEPIYDRSTHYVMQLAARLASRQG